PRFDALQRVANAAPFWPGSTTMSTPRPAVMFPDRACAAAEDALRIALEIGDRLLDAGDRAARIAHQRLDVAQPLPREARQPVGDGAHAGVERVGHLAERLQRLRGLGHQAARLVAVEQVVDLDQNAV